MKRTIVIALLLIGTALIAQDAGTANNVLPDELLNAPVKDWQLNGLTILVLLQVLGRGYKALRSGGGLKGIWSGIVSGTNTPTPPKA